MASKDDMTNLCVRIDKTLKEEFSDFCDNLGISASSACAIFIKKTVAEQRIPFDLTINRYDSVKIMGSNKNTYFPDRTGPVMHKNIIFRNALEACWAVFFETLGVKYEYHPKTFDTIYGEFSPSFKIKCYGSREYSENYPYDLFIAVTDGMDPGFGYKLKKVAFNKADDPESFAEGTDIPRIIAVSGIPKVQKIEDITDIYVLNNYDVISSVCDISPFNFEYVDGDVYAAFPGVKDGHFYLSGGDYDRETDYDFLVYKAYRAALNAKFEDIL